VVVGRLVGADVGAAVVVVVGGSVVVVVPIVVVVDVVVGAATVVVVDNEAVVDVRSEDRVVESSSVQPGASTTHATATAAAMSQLVRPGRRAPDAPGSLRFFDRRFIPLRQAKPAGLVGRLRSVWAPPRFLSDQNALRG